MLESREALVAVVSRGMVYTQWAFSFRNMVFPPSVGVAEPFMGLAVDKIRNRIVEDALRLGFEYLMFLDDDVCAPPHTYETLRSANADIVSGLYYRRWTPVEPMMYKDSVQNPVNITDFRVGDMVDVDLTGAGCLLVKMDVFRKIEPPWFEVMCYRTDIPKHEQVSEDFYFCRKARAAGLQPKVDTRVRCVHLGVGRAELGGLFYPAADVSEGPALSTGMLFAKGGSSGR